MFDIEIDGPHYVTPEGRQPFWVFDLLLLETDEDGNSLVAGAVSMFSLAKSLQRAFEIMEQYPEDFDGL